MKSFPFDLPDSLKSHLELFEKDQDKAIYMLQRHLTRRGYDAVGYFLLGWFYLMQEKRDEALECAVKARSYAPGSPFFMYLPYYFQHPALFDAWLPEQHGTPASIAYQQQNSSDSFFVDIDSLISRLSRRPGHRPAGSEEAQADPALSSSGSSEQSKPTPVQRPGRRPTRTLALIYEQQEEYGKAIETYRQLRQGSKDTLEQARYQDEIYRLQEEISENNGSGRKEQD